MKEIHSATAAGKVLEEVERALRSVGEPEFDRFCGLFADQQRRWFFAGQGRSGLVAEMAAMRFMHLGFQTHVVGEATAPAVRDGDGLVIISGSGRTPVSRSFARIAKQEGAALAVVTADAASPLADLADVTLHLTETADSRQFGGSLFEQTALLVLDAAALALSSGNQAAYASMAERHTNLQ